MYVVYLFLPVHYFCFVVMIRDESLYVCISPRAELEFEGSFWPTTRTLCTPGMLSNPVSSFGWKQLSLTLFLPWLQPIYCVVLHKL